MSIPNGDRIDRIPAWIKRVTQDLSISPIYEARFWNPPESQRYVPKHKRPPTPNNPKIYEAHVGISSPDGRVGTYKEFTQNILPRIRDLGYNVIQLMAIQEHAYYACAFVSTSLAFGLTSHPNPSSVWLPSHQLLCRELSIRHPGRASRTH